MVMLITYNFCHYSAYSEPIIYLKKTFLKVQKDRLCMQNGSNYSASTGCNIATYICHNEEQTEFYR